MATIRKRGSKFEVQVRRKGFPTLCRSFHTKADAQEWARFTETQADRGDMPAPLRLLGRYTFGSILERYRNEVSSRKKSFNTEIYIINALLREPIAKYPLTNISAADFSRYRERRLKDVTPRTVNRELSIVKHAFDVAMREWGVPMRENPLAKLKKLKEQSARSRRLEAGELEAIEEIAKTIRNPHILPLIHFAIATGMRRGEILRLRWSEIDFKSRTLFIPITKNGYSRTIPLSGGAIAILTERHNQPLSSEELVFPLSDNAAKLAWQRIVDKAGILDLHFHDLRHEAVSRFFERGLVSAKAAKTDKAVQKIIVENPDLTSKHGDYPL